MGETIAAILKKVYAYVSERLGTLRAIKTGMKVILYDRLWEAHRTYMKQGWIGLPDYRNVEYLHSAYKDLGGNGAADKMMEDFKKLPNDRPAPDEAL